MLSPAAPLTLQKRRAGPNAPAKAKLFLIHDGSGTVANYTKLQGLDCDVYGMYVLLLSSIAARGFCIRTD